MLEEIRIENFAIIESLELTMKPGLVTFTGETGAGKSIILDAIEALMGGRADTTVIRSGSNKAIVEATFKIPEVARTPIEEILVREDLLEDTDFITLGREVRREGRSVARLNGRTVNVSLLREIGNYLVDIHGQSEHLSLLNTRQHLQLLDRYAHSEALLQAYDKTFHNLVQLRQELRELQKSEEDAARLTDLLNFQVNEIEAAKLHPGEEEDLRQERDRLANAETLADHAQQSLILLEESTQDTPTISEMLGQLVEELQALNKIDSSKSTLAEEADTILDTLSDMTREIRDYLEEIEFNPRRLDHVEERLNLIHNLCRKYGGSIQSVLNFGAEARQKLENIAHAEERIAELEEKEKGLLETLAAQAKELSAHRQEASKILGNGVEQELNDLNMAGARFQVAFTHPPHPNGIPLDGDTRVSFDEHGIDQVEFLIAPNPGEGFKPLVKIASGGETSRLMLALKNVLAKADFIPTLIFDEIDQGIGGRIGMVVGEKLWQLAREHQVFCVTHLPQLAAFGEQHFRVRKEVDGGRTVTQVDLLNDSNRLNELATMLGELSEANLNAALDTLEHARQRITSHTGQAASAG